MRRALNKRMTLVLLHLLKMFRRSRSLSMMKARRKKSLLNRNKETQRLFRLIRKITQKRGTKTNRQKVLPIRMMQFLRTVRWKVNLCRLTLLTALRLLTVIHKRVCRLPRRKIQWTIRYPQRIILKKVRM